MTVPRGRLEALAALAPLEESARTPRGEFTGCGWTAAEVMQALTVQGIDYTEKTKQGYTVYKLDRCPTSDAHNDGAALGQMASGAWWFTCHHDSCQTKAWADARDAIGLRRPDSIRLEGSLVAGEQATGHGSPTDTADCSFVHLFG